MYSVMKNMDINYPAYVWTHNGWIQKMDASYSAHQWDTEPLVVHFVPFSHNDPGLLRYWLYTMSQKKGHTLSYAIS